MCEPSHSITQYPYQDQDGNPISGTLGKVASWGKKILNWFHYSKLGQGHSESSPAHLLRLPTPTKYEGFWWERKFTIDGGFYGPRFDREEALECAEFYHKETVMKNIQVFRRFLEQSMRNSNTAYLYVDRLLANVMNQKGRDNVHAKLKRVFGATWFQIWRGNRKETAIKIVMGATRKREFFNSNWSDDTGLWLPKKKEIILT